MTDLINQLGSRTSGIILMAVAAGVVAAGVGIILTSIWRWEAIDSLDTYRMSVFAHDAKTARDAARDAAQDLPHDATAALPSLDFSHDDAEQSVKRLVPYATAGQRRVLAAGDGLAQVLHGTSAYDVVGDDAALLSYLAALPKAGPSAAVKLATDIPPQRAILAITLQRRFEAAWAAGDGEAVRSASGPLLLLDPKQPDAGRLRAILYATDTSISAERFHGMVNESLVDPVARTAFIRQLCVLYPNRTSDLLAMIPPDKLSAEERTFNLSSVGGKLEDQVRNAIQHPDQDLIDILLPRTMNLGRIDLARPLFNLLTADRKTPHALAFATLEGDLATMLKLSNDNPDLIPRITAPVTVNHHMTFHLASPSGFIPHSRITVRIDGTPLSDDKILHWASLVTVDIGTASGLPFELRLGDRQVASGKLPP